MQQIVDVIIHKVYKNYKCDARTQGQAENGEHLALRQSILGLAVKTTFVKNSRGLGAKRQVDADTWPRHSGGSRRERISGRHRRTAGLGILTSHLLQLLFSRKETRAIA